MLRRCNVVLGFENIIRITTNFSLSKQVELKLNAAGICSVFHPPLLATFVFSKLWKTNQQS